MFAFLAVKTKKKVRRILFITYLCENAVNKQTCVGECFSNTLAPITNTVASHARNLGVIFDPALKFDKQINSVVKSAFFQLRMIAKIKSFISFKDLETVIHAFISTRLDYCNSLYLGVAQSCLSRLQFFSPTITPSGL